MLGITSVSLGELQHQHIFQASTASSGEWGSSRANQTNNTGGGAVRYHSLSSCCFSAHHLPHRPLLESAVPYDFDASYTDARFIPALVSVNGQFLNLPNRIPLRATVGRSAEMTNCLILPWASANRPPQNNAQAEWQNPRGIPPFAYSALVHGPHILSNVHGNSPG